MKTSVKSAVPFTLTWYIDCLDFPLGSSQFEIHPLLLTILCLFGCQTVFRLSVVHCKIFLCGVLSCRKAIDIVKRVFV